MAQSNSNSNLLNTLLSTLIRCFAPQTTTESQPQPEQQQQQPTMSDEPFSYADAAASTPDNYQAPPMDPDPEQEDQDTYAVDAALSACGDSPIAAAAQLWKLDSANRLKPGVDYKLNTQYKSKSYEEDRAPEPFIEYISDAVFEERPTYNLFKKLLDNYTAETGIPERQSAEELAEEREFLSAVFQSAVGQFTCKFLCANVPDCGVNDEESFINIMHDLWFGLYGRDGRADSSGFEHAFCGEIDDGKVKGLHNFLQVYTEEQRGNFNYKGFLTYGRKRDEYVEDDDRVITIRFEWLGYLKPASSMFVGVSPEFEICLYTLLWLSGAAGQEVELGAYDVLVKVYDMQGRVGAAFPELQGVDYNNPHANEE